MKFKKEILEELSFRMNENIDIIKSSFVLSKIDFDKKKLLNIEPIENHMSVLIESDPYLFFGKMLFSIINDMSIKVVCSNIACSLLLEFMNLIMDEFDVERIEEI